MLKLSSSRGIRIDVPVLSVSWSFEDHSVIIQALRKGRIEHEASDTGGVPRWKSSCPDRLAEATVQSLGSPGYFIFSCNPIGPSITLALGPFFSSKSFCPKFPDFPDHISAQVIYLPDFPDFVSIYGNEC